MMRKTFFLTITTISLVFLEFTASSALDKGRKCPQFNYPYFNEQCVNVSGHHIPCKDIRECDLADGILALGGWPTVCGWVEDGSDDNDDPMKWPKVCCGMPRPPQEDSLKKKFAKQVSRKTGSSTEQDEEESGNTAHCVLPLVPQPDTSVSSEDGFRFGNTPYSRQEFFKTSEFMLNIMNDSIFAMEFKTFGDSGVMFYVSSISNRRDYIGLFMQDGIIIYVFNCGSGSAVISSQNTYNDGNWHRVVFFRHGQRGELIIDDQEEVQGLSIGKATRVDDLDSPFYVGGLSEGEATRARINLQGINLSFPGCIRNVEAQDEPLTQDTRNVVTNITNCSSKVEDGTFFSANGGYLVLYEKYRVGQRISISLDIKPRSLSGVLMAIHGKEDYLILQLIDSRVEFTVDHGAGPVTATFSPGYKHDLCDGEFHTIEAEFRSNNSVTLSVDGVSSENGFAVSGVSSIDTFDRLYIGGLPESSSSMSGVQTTDPFMGCMRDLELNREAVSMAKSRIVGHVTLNSCPTT